MFSYYRTVPILSVLMLCSVLVQAQWERTKPPRYDNHGRIVYEEFKNPQGDIRAIHTIRIDKSRPFEIPWRGTETVTETITFADGKTEVKTTENVRAAYNEKSTVTHVFATGSKEEEVTETDYYTETYKGKVQDWPLQRKLERKSFKKTKVDQTRIETTKKKDRQGRDTYKSTEVFDASNNTTGGTKETWAYEDLEDKVGKKWTDEYNPETGKWETTEIKSAEGTLSKAKTEKPREYTGLDTSESKRPTTQQYSELTLGVIAEQKRLEASVPTDAKLHLEEKHDNGTISGRTYCLGICPDSPSRPARAEFWSFEYDTSGRLIRYIRFTEGIRPEKMEVMRWSWLGNVPTPIEKKP